MWWKINGPFDATVDDKTLKLKQQTDLFICRQDVEPQVVCRFVKVTLFVIVAACTVISSVCALLKGALDDSWGGFFGCLMKCTPSAEHIGN